MDEWSGGSDNISLCDCSRSHHHDAPLCTAAHVLTALPSIYSSLPLFQVVLKNLRIMNGDSRNGFGGAVEVNGQVDLTFIDCEFGGSISEWH